MPFETGLSRRQTRSGRPVGNGTVRPESWYGSDRIVRAVGNQAMGHVLRRDDPAERSAHAFATAIMGAPTPVATASPSPGSVPGGLDAATRAYFEARFGVDLGHVRVHTGPDATSSVAQLDTAAYTVGSDITLGAGERAGPNLVTAHELAHVVRGDAVGRVARAPQRPKYPPPKPGQTPFNFISEGPARHNWEIAATEVLEREFKEKFPSFDEAIRRFREQLATLPKAEGEDFADRMRDRVRKAFFRREYREPSFTYDDKQKERMKGGRSPAETLQLEHLQDVKTKTREGQVVEGRPDLALDPANVYFTEGGKGGTAPKGSLHAEKYRTIREAKIRSEEIRRGSPPAPEAPTSPTFEHPPAAGEAKVERSVVEYAGDPLEPVVEGSLKPHETLEGLLVMIQAEEFARLQQAEIGKFEKKLEQLSPRIDALRTKGNDVGITLIVERPNSFNVTHNVVPEPSDLIRFVDLRIDADPWWANVDPKFNAWARAEASGGTFQQQLKAQLRDEYPMDRPPRSGWHYESATEVVPSYRKLASQTGFDGTYRPTSVVQVFAGNATAARAFGLTRLLRIWHENQYYFTFEMREGTVAAPTGTSGSQPARMSPAEADSAASNPDANVYELQPSLDVSLSQKHDFGGVFIKGKPGAPGRYRLESHLRHSKERGKDVLTEVVTGEDLDPRWRIGSQGKWTAVIRWEKL
jgi:hypothetical protein